MKYAPALVLAAALVGSPGLQAQAGAPATGAIQVLPAELRSVLPVGLLAGRARLSVWGFQVYDATLWVAPGFSTPSFADHAFALELVYLRGFTSVEITKRSMLEMSRQGLLEAATAASWQRQLQEVIPDVRPGDRLTGINLPGVGARFLLNGKPHKALADVQLAERFFGIWLSEATSEPGMRRELVSQVRP